MVAGQTNCSSYVNIVGLTQYDGKCTMFGGQAILSQGIGKWLAALAQFASLDVLLPVVECMP
jgi:hypothetical protein